MNKGKLTVCLIALAIVETVVCCAVMDKSENIVIETKNAQLNMEKVGDLEKLPYKAEEIEESGAYLSSNYTYYLATVKITNLTSHQTYIPTLTVRDDSDDYIYSDALEYFGNSYGIYEGDDSNVIPAYTSVNVSYVISLDKDEEDSVKNIHVEYYDYSADKPISEVVFAK